MMLGSLLLLWPERRAEAMSAFRKARDLAPQRATPWMMLGFALWFEPEAHGDAVEAFRTAVQLDPTDIPAWGLFVLYLCLRPDWRPEALASANECLTQNARSPEALKAMATSVLLGSIGDLAHHAEAWAREALEKEPESAESAMTLAQVLTNRGKRHEALRYLEAALRDTEMVGRRKGDITELVVNIAAGGHTREAMLLVEGSSDAPALEPIVWALRLDAGERVSVAQEVLEVAEDIVAKIKKRREQLTEGNGESVGAA